MTAKISIAADPQDVWNVITDLDQAPATINSIISVERVDGSPGYSIGTRWRETRRVFGTMASEVMEVIDSRPFTHTKVFASSHGTDYVTTLTLDSVGGYTQLTMEIRGTPSLHSTWLSRATFSLAAPLISTSTRKAMLKDLADIKRAAEVRTKRP